jgi:deoxyribodipyrimidine photo-lyase
MSATIVLFRLDLRLADNPALTAAVSQGGPVIPVFVWSPEDEGESQPGTASAWWLHKSLEALARDLKSKGSRLIIRRGPTLKALRALASETGAGIVFWSRRYEPSRRESDEKVQAGLRDDGIQVQTFNSALLVEPDDVTTKKGDPFRVFTPFWKACLKDGVPWEPLPEPEKLRAPKRWPESLSLKALKLASEKVRWNEGQTHVEPGEAGAWRRLETFLDGPVAEYHDARDRPDVDGTSMLSPYLHFGELSPGHVWYAVQSVAEAQPKTRRGAEAFLRQLYWREFAYHLLVHEPHTVDKPLRPAFAAFPWRADKEALKAWEEGQTGYPYIDAGMRQLWHTGWMHNRVRMAVASFLVKDLLIPWQDGAKWFWETLVDADLANNTLGWQWTAGCGADAAPYFRIFNPVTQGKRFDPKGDYVRHWVPEIANLPDKYIHRPWQAPRKILAEAGIELGKTYPEPIVDHAEARARALLAYDEMRGT